MASTWPLAFPLLIAIASGLGCDLVATTQVVPAIANATAPATARKGMAVPIDVKVPLPDGCHGEPRAEATVDEATRTVTVKASRTYYKGTRGCPQFFMYGDASTSFVPTQVGTYRIKVRIQPASDAGSYDRVEPRLDPAASTTPQDVELKVEITE